MPRPAAPALRPDRAAARAPRWRRLAIAAALLPLLAAPTRTAAGFSLGVGATSAKVSSDALSETASGAGFELSSGYRAWQRVTFELFVSALGRKVGTRETTAIYYPADRAEVSVLGLGLRADLLSLSRHAWTPWLGAGVGLTTLNWQTYFYSQQGVGPYLAAGLDVELLRGLILRGRAWRISASTRDDYGHDTPRVSIAAVSAGIVYEFGRPSRPSRPRSAPAPAPAPRASAPEQVPVPTQAPAPEHGPVSPEDAPPGSQVQSPPAPRAEGAPAPGAHH